MILVLNCGSQSIKWKLFTKDLKVKKQGIKDVFNLLGYRGELKSIFKELKPFRNDIDKVGHRVVHGGEYFRKPTKINRGVITKLKRLNHLAPLHNPYNLMGILVSKKFFPKIDQIAVFDTEMYSNLPEYSSAYPLPQYILKRFRYKRYGFHGISHQYAIEVGSEKIKKPLNKLKIISCHLGGGSSVTAIDKGKVIDTSMGYTPMEGVMMMTRPGNIDPGIVLEMKKAFPLKRLNYILNHQSGVKGISGLHDMRDVLKSKSKQAKLAFNMFVYSVQKQIGAYFAVLGGCDLLIFTGSIGAGNPKTRKAISRLNILKKTKTIIIPTDEEKAIAQTIS